MTESLNTHIIFLLQLFEYRITFVNLQYQITNSKGDFIPKNRFEKYVLKNSRIQNKS